MAHAGQQLFNPANGLRTTFHTTSADSDGELLEVEWHARPGWAAGPKHIHPLQEERFEVLEGRARSYVDGVEREHAAGDVIVAPPGAVHTIRNVADQDLRLMVAFRPALRSEQVLETLAALAQLGRTNGEGVPRNPLELALVIHTYEQEIHFARPPLALQRAIFGPLAALGRRLGRSAEVPYPVSPQAAPAPSPRTA